MDVVKMRLNSTIDEYSEQLVRLSHDIHANPEIAFTEYKSSKLITDFLESLGFDVKLGVGGLDTAFIASKEGMSGGPHVAFLAEYDSLPGIGHACGHNIIATSAVGAFIGMSSVLNDFCGKISIIGTPAEEGGCGKGILLENGVFDDVNFALMMHPSSGKSLINRGGRAATHVHIKFHGRATHSSNPGKGVNALSAVISTFNHIDLMRPTFEMQDNVNGIITEGGKAANVIPGEAACEFSLRARTMLDLEKLIEKIKAAVRSAETLTGASAEVLVDRIYAERYPSLPMCEAFKANMKTLGEEMEYPDPHMLYGSSDLGNVSIKIPAIHDYLAIAPEGVNSHHPDFEKAACSLRADEICIKAAKGLAMTAVDVLGNPEFQSEIIEYHRKQVPEEYRNR